MKITFLGATRTVTGSNILVETNGKKFIMDCGLYQGQQKETAMNTENFLFSPADVDFVLLSHAHIDHSGRIPKLYVDGYRGPVYATKATCDLCGIMLPDSGYIQESEAQWINKRRKREGKPALPPLYTYDDAINSLGLFERVQYDETIQIDANIKVRFRDAGHMLGSSIIEVWVKEDGKDQKIVFTGDLGNNDIPLLREHVDIDEADILITESTYGGKNHENSGNRALKFLDVVSSTLEKGGNVIIPSFAVGRTQEILYEIQKTKQTDDEEVKRKFDEVLDAKVFVDSPLATSATEIFLKNLDCLDEEVQQDLRAGKRPLEFNGLRFTQSVDESKELNEKANQSIIISASGMCEVGRIKHHLKHNLWRNDSTILFVGYQAVGSLGRRIVDGAKTVKIFGEDVTVNANVKYIEAYSGHADQENLLKFIDKFTTKPKQIYVVHGEEENALALAEAIRERFGIPTEVPSYGDVYEIDFERIRKTAELSARTENTFMRLKAIEKMATLKEELEDMISMVKEDLREDMPDVRVRELLEKLKLLENQIIEIIK